LNLCTTNPEEPKKPFKHSDHQNGFTPVAALLGWINEVLESRKKATKRDQGIPTAMQFDRCPGTANKKMEVMMKLAAKVLLTIVFAFVLWTTSAFAVEIFFSGFLGSQAEYDKLTPGSEDGALLRWLDTSGIRFSKYNKFMVDSVIFYLADDADYKGIDPQQMKEMADSFNMALVNAFKGKYPIVAEPGPDVARIRFAITHIKPSKPGISAVTSIVPVGLAVSVAKKNTEESWIGSGGTGTEMMVLDSMTNKVIAMAADQQQASFGSRFVKWGSTTDAFKFWAERVVEFIDNAKGIERDTSE